MTSSAAKTAHAPEQVIVRIPSPHTAQGLFYYWSEWHENAQVLIAPCGTKVGKSFGAAAWMATEALTNPGLFCVWIAPTYRKAKIGFRYIRAMLPDCAWVRPVEGKLEIRFGNGSVIHFLHGHDAEVTVEGEAIDRFVIDEAAKTKAQVWFSLITTITQTGGKGIITGTPRGRNWYKKVFDEAGDGATYNWNGDTRELSCSSQGANDFYVRVTLPTECSPFVQKKNIEQAQRLLPAHLYQQYYDARFVSESTVFGDLGKMYDLSLERNGRLMAFPGARSPSHADRPIKTIDTTNVRFWLHPDAKVRQGTITHGVDLAKKQDYTVFYSVNQVGQVVGYVRFRRVGYKVVSRRLRDYVTRYFAKCENVVRYDETGVGGAVGEDIGEAFDEAFDQSEIDVSVTGVTFTNKLKVSMVTRMIMAIEDGWHKAPRIDTIDNEFSGYEVSVTKHGNCTYSAPDGQHDDVVSAAMLAVSHAYQAAGAEAGEAVMAEAMGLDGHDGVDSDILEAYAGVATGTIDKDDDDFFDSDEDEEGFEFDEETA